MPDLLFYGASDDCVEFEGAIHDEFYTRPDGTWTGTLQDTDGGTAQLRATWCVENPDGWHLEVTDHYGDCPWPITKAARDDRPEDPMLVLTVPDGIVVDEDQPQD